MLSSTSNISILNPHKRRTKKSDRDDEFKHTADQSFCAIKSSCDEKSKESTHIEFDTVMSNETNEITHPAKSALTTLFDVHYGRVRRLHQDSWGTESACDTADAIPPESYLTKRHSNGLLCYPFVEQPELPSSELVLAVHYYVSQQCHKYHRHDLFQLYDETVLLTIAIELEEMIKKQLGPNGHLAFAQVKGSNDL